MTTISMPTFLLIITILSLTSTTSVSISPSPTASVASSNDTNFIRTSCQTTLYKETCYQSLSIYANTVQQDPARLVLVAINLSLTRATNMTIYVTNLSRQTNNSPRAVAALHDCCNVFGDAVDLIRNSMKQMKKLSAGGEELRFQMSNVQTWMSAALTNEDTCADGFQGVHDEVDVKVEVCDRTREVKEVTSNALALVNSYADKVCTTIT